MPGCSHQATNQAIPERKVSNWVAMDICEVVHEAGGRVSEMFTVKEVAGHFRSIIENLIHSLRYKKIAIEEYKVDQRDEVTGIFIDFILCQEGLVHDRCFTVESSANKYVAGKTISQARFEESQHLLKAIFTERAEAA